MIKTLLICFILNVIFAVHTGAQPFTENIKLTTAEWREDLKFFADGLRENHKNAFYLTSRAEFERAVANLDRQIPQMKNYEIIVGFQKLAAMIGDGHTFVAARDVQRSYPFEFSWFTGELRVVRATAEYQKTLGTRLVAINGINLREINRRLQSVISQDENEYYVSYQSAMQITRAELLAALKITATPDSAEFIFQYDDGKIFALKAHPLAPNSKPDWLDVVENPPLYLQKPSEAFAFTFLPANQAVYVNFRFYDGLEENAKKLMRFLDEKRAQLLIIDLRHNGGGNFSLVRQHLIYQVAQRRSINKINHLFVITGRRTFSAAMTNAIDFRRETDALLIGEPPGARPNGYQENFWFMLPNSRINASVSMLRYRFSDKDVPAVLPDIAITTSWDDYRSGRDPVLEKIFALR